MLDKNFIQRKIKLIQEELSKLESLSPCFKMGKRAQQTFI
jgi:hypothetical protein